MVLALFRRVIGLEPEVRRQFFSFGTKVLLHLEDKDVDDCHMH